MGIYAINIYIGLLYIIMWIAGFVIGISDIKNNNTVFGIDYSNYLRKNRLLILRRVLDIILIIAGLYMSAKGIKWCITGEI